MNIKQKNQRQKWKAFIEEHEKSGNVVHAEHLPLTRFALQLHSRIFTSIFEIR
jgi:hypothetical protein